MKKFLGKIVGCGLGVGLVALATSATAEQSAIIYSMDNAAVTNHVMVFHRDVHGQLNPMAQVATGGAGTGAGLSSQGSVVLSHDGRWLIVCNAGSDEISVFAAKGGVLELTDRVNSGGRQPVSLALHGNLLYVLNAGGAMGEPDNITGFTFGDGKLMALAGSSRGLSGSNTGPAQVSFTADGDALVVTETATSLIDTFVVGADGTAGSQHIFASVGRTPFGFAVGRRDRLFVSEANGGVVNGSSTSSYSISDSGELTVISGAVPTEQTAACWAVLSGNGRFVYTANAGSGSISGYSISAEGSLRLLSPSGITAVTGAGSHPVDMAESRGGRFLFVLANGNGTLNAFHIAENGLLGTAGVVTGLPTSSAGLAAR